MRGIGPFQPPRLHRGISEPIDRFQVMGERCSGTNHLAELMRRNFPSLRETDELGWKHGFFDRRQAEVPGLLVLMICRHPVRWIQSVHRSPWELSARMRGLDLGALMRATWEPAIVAEDGSGREYPIQGDMVPHTDQCFENAWHLRAAKLAWYTDVLCMQANGVILRHEDVNRAPGKCLHVIAAGMNLQPPTRFTTVHYHKDNRNVPYMPRRFPALSAQDADFIRAEIDWDCERGLGYDPLSIPRYDGLTLLDRPVALRVWKQIKAAMGFGRPLR